MSVLDYREIERKPGRTLTKAERKQLNILEHKRLGLPDTRGEIKAIERRKRTLDREQAKHPVQGGAPGPGKR